MKEDLILEPIETNSVVEKAFNDVYQELHRAKKQHPGWPDNEFEQLSIISEELGELHQAVLQAKHDGAPRENIRQEAQQVGAMVIRFLMNLE